jgi:hypothetical protein
MQVAGNLAEHHRLSMIPSWRIRIAAGNNEAALDRHTADGRVGETAGERLTPLLQGFAHEVLGALAHSVHPINVSSWPNAPNSAARRCMPRPLQRELGAPWIAYPLVDAPFSSVMVKRA